MRNEHDKDGKYIPCKSIDDMSLEELRDEARHLRRLLDAEEGENKIFSLPYLVEELLSERDHYARRD